MVSVAGPASHLPLSRSAEKAGGVLSGHGPRDASRRARGRWARSASDTGVTASPSGPGSFSLAGLSAESQPCGGIARSLLAFPDSERGRDSLKQALEAHASERGLSLTRALVELLERGLAPIAEEQSVREREGKLAAATSELTERRARLKQAELGLQAAREREKTTARTHRAFAARARHELAPCPQCRKPLRGFDLLISGHCPHCDKPLTSLLVPTRLGGLVQNEYLALLGALAVLVGLALATDEANAD